MFLEQSLIDTVLNEALKNGGQFAEIFVESKNQSGVRFDNGKIEELSNGGSKGAGIRVIFHSSTGFAHTADLSEESLIKTARAASQIAKNEGVIRDISVWKNNHVPSFAELGSKNDHIRIIEKTNDSAREYGSEIVQVSVDFGNSMRSFQVANSDGVNIGEQQARTRLSVTSVAKGDTGLQTGYESVAETTGLDLFNRMDPSDIGRESSRRASIKLQAQPCPSGEITVVLAGGSGGILFHEACGHGLEADHIVKDASVYTNKVGHRVASSIVTLVDNGTVGHEWGTSTFDDEGHPTRENVLIKDGELVGYMYDFQRGSHSNGSSGNGRRQSYKHLPMVRMTNTYLMPGDATKDEIISDTKYGIYVAKLGGGSVNTATGDFVFGTIEAYLIENGKITTPIRDANLIGNGPDILKKIDAIADDFSMMPGTCGKDGQLVPVGCGQPTLRITSVTVGGTVK